MRARNLTASTAALGLGAALVASAGAGSAQGAVGVNTLSSCHDTLAGHRYVVSTDIGFVESYSYNAQADQLTATVIDGAPFGLPTGAVYTEQVATAPVAPGVFMVSWVEPGGYTVSQAQNLHTGQVQLYWTFPDGQGGQLGEQHTGTVTCRR